MMATYLVCVTIHKLSQKCTTDNVSQQGSSSDDLYSAAAYTMRVNSEISKKQNI